MVAQRDPTSASHLTILITFDTGISAYNETKYILGVIINSDRSQKSLRRCFMPEAIRQQGTKAERQNGINWPHMSRFEELHF